MKRLAFFLLAVLTVAGIVAHMAHASGQSDGDSSPIYDRREPARIRRPRRAIARSTRQPYRDQGL